MAAPFLSALKVAGVAGRVVVAGEGHLFAPKGPERLRFEVLLLSDEFPAQVAIAAFAVYRDPRVPAENVSEGSRRILE